MSLDQLIPVINKLQDVFNTVGGDAIDLPQIVVIGSQSSGKSSVLENIVGRDFLPRGSGIVTRRPLVLQLISVPASGDPSKEEWGEFLHKPNVKFYSFSDIRSEIEAETDRLTGSNKGISPNPIRLRICSPHVLNLTLVDLPGMTRVPVGDQPADIELQIRAMIMHFIEKKNAIILSVSAANTDIANSDGIMLAKEVDPEGRRTIGVITKIDIMDKGTDALDVLLGRVIPLTLGFVGVMNRSQLDIKNGKTIRDALKTEQEFFASHPLYRSIASQCGTPYLSKLLNRVLLSHIRDCIPELKARVAGMMSEAQAELRSYGDSYIDNKGAILLQIITKFSNDFCDAIDGKMEGGTVNELYGGARINFIFTEIFTRCLKSIQPLGDLSPSFIRTAIKNATGPRDSLFIPEASFELLVRKQVQRLEEPSRQCADLVFDELLRIVEKLEVTNLQAYKNLQRRVGEVVANLLSKCKKPTVEMISNLISIEHSYINTAHKDFIGGGGALSGIFESMAISKQQEQIALQQEQLAQQGGMPQQQQQPGQPQRPPQPQNPPGRSQAAQQQQPSRTQGQPQQGQPQQGQPGFFNRFFGNQQQGQQGQPGQPGQQGQQGQQRPPVPQQAAPPRPQQAAPPRPQQSAPRRHGAGDRLEDVPRTIIADMPSSDSESFEMELITKLLNSYFLIVRKNVADTVPKSIMHFLVNTAKTNMQNELIRCLYKEEYFAELLEENPAIAEQRKACKALLEVLQRANMVLQELRDYNVGGY